MTHAFCWSIAVLLMSCVTTKKPSSESQSQQMAAAKKDFDIGDYNGAIQKFEALRRQDPDNPLVWDYLSQALIGRSGLQVAKVVETVVEAHKLGEPGVKMFSELMENLPPSDPLVRSDLAESIRMLAEYNQTHDGYLKQNEVVYRVIYASYLLKGIVSRIEDEELQDLNDLPRLTKTLLTEKSADIVDIAHQFESTFSDIDSISSGKLKDKIKKLTEKKQISFVFKSKNYNINFKDGFKKGLEDFVDNAFDYDRVELVKRRLKELREYVDKKVPEIKNDDEFRKFEEDFEKRRFEIKTGLEKLEDSESFQDLKSELDSISEKIRK